MIRARTLLATAALLLLSASPALAEDPAPVPVIEEGGACDGAANVCGEGLECVTYPAAVPLSKWAHLWRAGPLDRGKVPVYRPTPEDGMLEAGR